MSSFQWCGLNREYAGWIPVSSDVVGDFLHGLLELLDPAVPVALVRRRDGAVGVRLALDVGVVPQVRRPFVVDFVELVVLLQLNKRNRATSFSFWMNLRASFCSSLFCLSSPSVSNLGTSLALIKVPLGYVVVLDVLLDRQADVPDVFDRLAQLLVPRRVDELAPQPESLSRYSLF